MRRRRKGGISLLKTQMLRFEQIFAFSTEVNRVYSLYNFSQLYFFTETAVMSC